MSEALRLHTVANLFPDMREEEFAAFKESIVAAGGVKEPLKVWADPKSEKEYIVDGKNRRRAVRELIEEGKLPSDYEPPTEKLKGGMDEPEMIEYITGLNRDRRHLKSSQKAAITVLLDNRLGKLSKRSGEEEGDHAERLAVRSGTNRAYIFDCRTLAAEAEDLLEKVKDGEFSIPEAMTKLRVRKITEEAPDLGQAVNEGRMTIREAEEEIERRKGWKERGEEPPPIEIGQPTPPPPPVIKDGLGNVVEGEEALVSLFADRERFHSVIKQLRTARAAAVELASGDSGSHIHGQELRAAMSAAIREVSNSIPYVVCPTCKGNGKKPGGRKACEACGGTRFLDKLQYTHSLSEEERAKVGGGEDE